MTLAATAPHGLAVGDQVTIASGISAYNGLQTVATVTAPNVFTYTFGGSGTSPATGTLTYGGFPATTTRLILNRMVASLVAAGVSRVLLLSKHLCNYPTSGDITGSPPYITSQPGNGSGTGFDLWTAQHNAYSDSVAAYPGKLAWVDLYGGEYSILNGNSSLIWRTGQLPAAPWHVADNNVHLTYAGSAVVAGLVQAAIQAQSGWQGAIT